MSASTWSLRNVTSRGTGRLHGSNHDRVEVDVEDLSAGHSSGHLAIGEQVATQVAWSTGASSGHLRPWHVTLSPTCGLTVRLANTLVVGYSYKSVMSKLNVLT